jgi:ectoine hydroxylase-related dioxygenase (phytanoyl-CoA dioxygenase family)
MTPGLSARNADWLPRTLETLREAGHAVVTDVVPRTLIESVRPAMYRVQEEIRRELGSDRLARAGEVGLLRLMLKYDPCFFRFLELEAVLRIVDETVGTTGILHTQNGFILPSSPRAETPTVFQNTFHRDFPRYLNGYVMSVNTMLAIDEFTRENGATLVVPGTHQRPEIPSEEQLRADAIPAECPAGSMVVFDSTLWHAAGANTSGKDRLSINQQFTRSYVKQQIDYVRALGEGIVVARPPRTQQLLGYYTRVVTSLDEYYQPEERRLYRKGQG